MSSKISPSKYNPTHHRRTQATIAEGFKQLGPARSESVRTEKELQYTHIIQGVILFLPAESDLPKNAVRRAHGKGRIEDKIHNHPVVVISRPANESNIVHFHLVSESLLKARRTRLIRCRSPH